MINEYPATEMERHCETKDTSLCRPHSQGLRKFAELCTEPFFHRPIGSSSGSSGKDLKLSAPFQDTTLNSPRAMGKNVYLIPDFSDAPYPLYHTFNLPFLLF